MKTMNDSDANLQALIASIDAKLSALVGLQLGPMLAAELQDDRARIVYELTGTSTADEIAKRVGSSKKTIIEYWSRWSSMGMIVRDGKGFKRLLDVVVAK